MVRVNRRQKEILDCLNKKFPNSLAYEVLLAELGKNPLDILFLDDLKFKGLIDMSWTSFIYPNGTRAHEIPKDSWITLEGRKKVKEALFRKLMLFLMVIIGIEVAIILILIKLY